MKFKVGDKVYKPKGYKFPGIVVAVFQTTSGETRIVAELMTMVCCTYLVRVSQNLIMMKKMINMKNTPLQNVIDRVEKLAREAKENTEEKRKLNIVISYLWDELQNERYVMSEIYEKSKKEDNEVTGKMWIEKNFIDYQKFL